MTKLHSCDWLLYCTAISVAKSMHGCLAIDIGGDSAGKESRHIWFLYLFILYLTMRFQINYSVFNFLVKAMIFKVDFRHLCTKHPPPVLLHVIFCCFFLIHVLCNCFSPVEIIVRPMELNQQNAAGSTRSIPPFSYFFFLWKITWKSKKHASRSL